jgi:AraC-like DNA-binding protein
VVQHQKEVVRHVATRSGTLELIEWHWPDIVAFEEVATDLMLEQSLPPYSTDSIAEFPDIAAGERCFMGTLFIRYPGVTIVGRGEGVRSRVLRVTFAPKLADKITNGMNTLPLAVLQSLLDIRSDILRSLLRLAHLELSRFDPPSTSAINGYIRLIALETERLLAEERANLATGRLAPWQLRRIKHHLRDVSPRPNIDELAKICGISARHLQRQFASVSGKNISKYVEDFWIERARELLINSRQPIKAIAAQCGFSHANSFARAFSRATGIMPHLLRQRSAWHGAMDADRDAK